MRVTRWVCMALGGIGLMGGSAGAAHAQTGWARYAYRPTGQHWGR